MTHKFVLLLAVVILGFGIAREGAAQIAPTEVLLYVDAPASAWAPSHLAEELAVRLTRDSRLLVRVVRPDDSVAVTFPDNWWDLDAVSSWGREFGGRYLAIIKVEQTAIERRKSFQLPLVFHRWETMAIMSGEIRIIDLSRERLLFAEGFEEVLPLKRAFQVTPDDDQFDPDLHVRATEKIRAFRALDRQASVTVVNAIHAHASRRNGR